MTPGPGIEPGTHWWKASALTTAPTLLHITHEQCVTIPHFLYPAIIRKRDNKLRYNETKFCVVQELCFGLSVNSED